MVAIVLFVFLEWGLEGGAGGVPVVCIVFGFYFVLFLFCVNTLSPVPGRPITSKLKPSIIMSQLFEKKKKKSTVYKQQ